MRVVSELGLDTDPEFQSHGLELGQLAKQLGIVAKRFGIVDWPNGFKIADLAERVGIAGSVRAFEDSEQTTIAMEKKADKVDRAADELIKRLDISQNSYIISVSATARDPVKAQRLASAIANDYLASQREARQQALDHVAVWLKGRMDSLQSHASDTEASIEKLKVESGLHDTESDKVQEQQLHDLNTQLMAARADVNETSVRLEQARHVIDTNGDVNSISELSGSAMERAARPTRNGDVESIPEGTVSNTLKELRERQMELNSRLADLQSRFGERNIQIISARADLRPSTSR